MGYGTNRFDMEIEHHFIDSNGTMMDEAMVSKCTLHLLLQTIFFMMQNVGSHF